jgi:hypothetical protein
MMGMGMRCYNPMGNSPLTSLVLSPVSSRHSGDSDPPAAPSTWSHPRSSSRPVSSRAPLAVVRAAA